MDNVNVVPIAETGEVEVFEPHVDVFDAILVNQRSWALWFDNEDLFLFRTDDSGDALLKNLVPLKGLASCTPQSVGILVRAVAENVDSVIVCRGTYEQLTAILRAAIEIRELRSNLELRINQERNQLLGKAA